MRERSLPASIVAMVFFCLSATVGVDAQVIIRDRVVIAPDAPGSGADPAGLYESVLSPCNPPVGDPGPPVITRLSVFPGASLSLAALTCPGCPPHHMAGELTQGAEFVRLELNRPAGEGGQITGTTFHFREAWGYDVLAVFDGAIPPDSAVIRFTMTYVDFPPPNTEYIEVYYVRRQFRLVTRVDPPEVEQGGTAGISVWVQDQCGGGYPVPVTYTASIAEGLERGVLQNPLTMEKGESLAGLAPPSGYIPTVVYLAEGEDADSTTMVRIRLVASAAGVDPMEIVLPVKPGPTCPVVTLDPPEVSTGDTCRIHIMMRTYGGVIRPYPPDQRFAIMLYPGESGTLYSPSAPDTADYLSGVTQERLCWLAAQEIQEESVSVYMWVNTVEGGANNGRGTLATERVEKGRRAWTDRKQGQVGAGLGPEEESCNAAFANLKKKPFEIMLGETKYFRVLPVGDQLRIEESQVPFQPTETDYCTLTVDSQTGGEQPTYHEKRDSTGHPLGADQIRLIGLRRRNGGAASTTLIGRSESKEIRATVLVVNPGRLGFGYHEAADVFGTITSIDSLTIAAGNSFGVPPQFLKSIAFAESKMSPAYRYEPFFDAMYVQNNDKFIRGPSRFWIATQIDQGDPEIPSSTEHRNINPGPLLYPDTYWGFQGTIWSFLTNHSSTVNPTIVGQANLYPKKNSSGKSLWSLPALIGWDSVIESTTQQLRTMAGMSREGIAMAVQDSAKNWLRTRFFGGVLDSATAQTRISSSFGLLQIMYSTALERGYSNNSPEHLPEFLMINDTAICLAVSHLSKCILDELRYQRVTSMNDWPLGYDSTMSLALSRYNGGGRRAGKLASAHRFEYGPRVRRYAAAFRPRGIR